MARFKRRQYPMPDEIEFLGLVDILARAHPRDRRVPGIYFLIDGQEIVYVGQSMNLPLRIDQHRRESRKTFDRFTVYPCPEKLLDKLERHYIHVFRPKYNATPVDANDFLSGKDARDAARIIKQFRDAAKPIPSAALSSR